MVPNRRSMDAGWICPSAISAPERILPFRINSRISCDGKIPVFRGSDRVISEKRAAGASVIARRRHLFWQTCQQNPITRPVTLLAAVARLFGGVDFPLRGSRLLRFYELDRASVSALKSVRN